MKKPILFFFIFIGTFALAQSPKGQKIKYVTIDQKVCSNQKDFQLVLKSIVTDSRCPEGVTCIWAGEVTAIVSVYKDSKLIEDATLLFAMKNEKENKEWFAKYLPRKQKNIKTMQVLPFPKEGKKIDSKEYCLKIGYYKQD